MLNTDTMMFIILAIIFIMVVIALILAIINSSKISAFMDYGDEGDLMEGVKEYYDKVEELASTINNSSDAVIQNRIFACENNIKQGFSKIAVVNFDAFDDVKGGMSFAFTILNENNDGVILTSLYGHNSCNTYIREIKNGVSSVKLTDEELQSLLKAKNKEQRSDTNE